MSDSLFDDCRSFSDSLLTSFSHAKGIGLGEFFKMVATKLEAMDRSNSNILKWDFAIERDELVVENSDGKTNKLKAYSNLPLRHPFFYWNFHQHIIRKALFHYFFDKASMIPSLKDSLSSLSLLFFGDKQSKIKASLDNMMHILESPGSNNNDRDGEKKKRSNKTLEEVIGRKMLERIELAKTEVQTLTVEKTCLFWCIEPLFWKTGFFNKLSSSTTHLAVVFAMLSGCVYVDAYQTRVSFGDQSILANLCSRPVHILSQFASTNGGADDLFSLTSCARSDNDAPEFLRRIKKVRFSFCHYFRYLVIN
jgi:hypothetical protein